MHRTIVLGTLCAAGLAAGLGMAPTFGQDTKDAAAAPAGSGALIGHALSMAIESSGLAATAAAAGATAPSATPSTAPSAAAATTSGRPALRDIEARNAAADAQRSAASTTDEHRPGSGTAAAANDRRPANEAQPPGGTTVEPYGSGRTVGEIEKAAARDSGVAAATRPDATPRTAATDRPEMATRPEPAAATTRPDPMSAFAQGQLRQHAMRGFEESNALFEQAARNMSGTTPEMNQFLTHARSYARILQALSQGKSAAATGATDNVLSSPTVPLGQGEIQAVRLVNHGVTEALDSWKLNALPDSQGQNEASAVLRRHAQDMKAESRRLLEAVAAQYPSAATRAANATAAGTTTGGPSLADAVTAGAGQRTTAANGAGVSNATAGARPAVESNTGNESVAMLIQEARELIQILDHIGG
ncbi:hypothetical protein OJF2_18970 [Aquisphaera giovannonii]|uniref:DUF4142 domain-containing protein n=1 Tax=Aquisphaera giovannonii TaxID=406548 RepID=A0A5B9VYE5_9BACT|nr:hypothetical protein [Aquisphaera giovannonii]QEH33396.1 hypothetical protein OJF2_18970 [Aquisphaera giovannonii]